MKMSIKRVTEAGKGGKPSFRMPPPAPHQPLTSSPLVSKVFTVPAPVRKRKLEVESVAINPFDFPVTDEFVVDPQEHRVKRQKNSAWQETVMIPPFLPPESSPTEFGINLNDPVERVVREVVPQAVVEAPQYVANCPEDLASLSLAELADLGLHHAALEMPQNISQEVASLLQSVDPVSQLTVLAQQGQHQRSPSPPVSSYGSSSSASLWGGDSSRLDDFLDAMDQDEHKNTFDFEGLFRPSKP